MSICIKDQIQNMNLVIANIGQVAQFAAAGKEMQLLKILSDAVEAFLKLGNFFL